MTKVTNALLMLITLLIACSTRADIRNSVPVVAGTQLVFPRISCTAGLIVQKTGIANNFTQYRQALRFAVTAGHCGNVNDFVKVNGRVIGRMVWKSNISDLGLVQVEPSLRNFTRCSAPSTGVHCTIASVYDPLAEGKIILPSLRTRNIAPIPVIGTGDPSRNELFCTSGNTTGVNCTWGLKAIPGWVQSPYSTARYAETISGLSIGSGDSGGPVASADGRVYGIMTHSDRDYNYMMYAPISQFFHEQADYRLAP